MKRRALLHALGALAGAAGCGRPRTHTENATAAMKEAEPSSTYQAPMVDRPGARTPTVFLAHGSPMLLDDAVWRAELKHGGTRWGNRARS